MADAAPVGFGGGLGAVIGGELGHEDINQGINAVSNASTNAFGTVNALAGPYNAFGQSFLPTATNQITKVADTANNTQGYDQFMSTYTNTPAAQYQLQQANKEQNNTAAARGGLLSGANERALATMDNGIIAQNANNAYNEYLAGNSQQFGQLETALGNMFNAIGVGTTATGQEIPAVTGITSSQNTANASLAASQAKNDQGKGAGMGSMFSGLGAMALAF